MMFTDRYLEIPIIMNDGKDVEKNERLGTNIPLEDLPSKAKIKPMDISTWWATPDDSSESEELVHTIIEMRYGRSFYIPMLVKDFEKLLNDFNQ